MKTSAISWTVESGTEKVDDGTTLPNGRCPHPLSLTLILLCPTPFPGVCVGNLGTLPEVVFYTTALPAMSAQVVRLAVVRKIGGGPFATFAAFGSLTCNTGLSRPMLLGSGNSTLAPAFALLRRLPPPVLCGWWSGQRRLHHNRPATGRSAQV